ncbi:predicted protein [Naegleria gruberi]|uniref:Predicted protein n=1 Tax=Naegleria gruberi TaxID=5762 RepID=D2W5F7_NAEGR|nr:uncharacterized protein NAEGRDRAFT_76649 [Naegleria gruberi]EFC35697.1 predicted protein [Naegleria gruberi]|eukprot:XP_002668441.1 predicted protein [Naegleria gruberi strain NEG-M]
MSEYQVDFLYREIPSEVTKDILSFLQFEEKLFGSECEFIKYFFGRFRIGNINLIFRHIFIPNGQLEELTFENGHWTPKVFSYLKPELLKNLKIFKKNGIYNDFGEHLLKFSSITELVVNYTAIEEIGVSNLVSQMPNLERISYYNDKCLRIDFPKSIGKIILKEIQK